MLLIYWIMLSVFMILLLPNWVAFFLIIVSGLLLGGLASTGFK